MPCFPGQFPAFLIGTKLAKTPAWSSSGHERIPYSYRLLSSRQETISGFLHFNSKSVPWSSLEPRYVAGTKSLWPRSLPQALACPRGHRLEYDGQGTPQALSPEVQRAGPTVPIFDAWKVQNIKGFHFLSIFLFTKWKPKTEAETHLYNSYALEMHGHWKCTCVF